MPRMRRSREDWCRARAWIVTTTRSCVARHMPGAPLISLTTSASDHLAMPRGVLNHRDRQLRLKRPQAPGLGGRRKLAASLGPDDRGASTLDRLLHQLRERKPRSIRVARSRRVLVRDESRRFQPARRLLTLSLDSAAKLLPRARNRLSIRVVLSPARTTALSRPHPPRFRCLIASDQSQRRPTRPIWLATRTAGWLAQWLRGWLCRWHRRIHLPKGTTCAAKRNQSPIFGGGTVQSVPLPGRSPRKVPAKHASRGTERFQSP